jgi:hypothetical protein
VLLVENSSAWFGSYRWNALLKRTDSSQRRLAGHRANANETDYLVLNILTAATGTTNTRWNNTAPTEFCFHRWFRSNGNDSGGTYVAYLFAHDAGGFGDDGEQNVISCGSYTWVTVLQRAYYKILAWEPQWVLIKSSTDGSQDWTIFDNMRGVTTGVGAVDARLHPNKSDAENNSFDYVQFDATGFTPMRSQTLSAKQFIKHLHLHRNPPWAYENSGSGDGGV